MDELKQMLPPAFYFLSGEMFNKKFKSFWVEEFKNKIQIRCKKCVSGFNCEFAKNEDGSFRLSEIHSTAHDIVKHPYSTDQEPNLKVSNEITESEDDIESYLTRILSQDPELFKSYN